jgi:hypothetical protein
LIAFDIIYEIPRGNTVCVEANLRVGNVKYLILAQRTSYTLSPNDPMTGIILNVV